MKTLNIVDLQKHRHVQLLFFDTLLWSDGGTPDILSVGLIFEDGAKRRLVVPGAGGVALIRGISPLLVGGQGVASGRRVSHLPAQGARVERVSDVDGVEIALRRQTYRIRDLGDELAVSINSVALVERMMVSPTEFEVLETALPD